MTVAQQRWTAVAVVIVALGAGFALQRAQSDDEPAAETTSSEVDTETTTTAATTTVEPTTTLESTTTVAETTTTTTTTVPVPEVIVEVLPVEPPSVDTANAFAATLAPAMVLPSDCGLPYDVAASLPNSPRDYRSGTHQGVDFICLEYGRDALAAMDGRVVVAVGDYVDPAPADRSAVLDIAAAAGETPAYTLVMLYGNYVVLDHGVVDGVGHVISIYAHLEELDAAIRPGIEVVAGQRLGEIGNKGTNTASQNGDRPQSIHLHWELHVDGLYLGAGLDAVETAALYRILFPA